MNKIFEGIPYERLYGLDSNLLMGILLSVSVICGGILYFVLIIPQEEVISGINNEITEMRRKIEENKTHIARREELQKHIWESEERLAVYNQQLPTKKEIPDLLENLSNMVVRFGLDLPRFVPEQEQIKDFYSEVPVDIVARGKYHNMLSFIDEVSRMPRIVTISNVEIVPNVTTSAKDRGYAGIELKCKAVTYRYLGPVKESKEGK